MRIFSSRAIATVVVAVVAAAVVAVVAVVAAVAAAAVVAVAVVAGRSKAKLRRRKLLFVSDQEPVLFGRFLRL